MLSCTPRRLALTLGMAGAILSEASWSVPGPGVQPPTPSWGAMLDAGRAHRVDAPHLTQFPGASIALVVRGFNLLGDGLRDWLSPRWRCLLRAGPSGPRGAAQCCVRLQFATPGASRRRTRAAGCSPGTVC
jgi:hypothetical protein